MNLVADTTEDEGAQSTGRVLVVDDDESMRDILQSILKKDYHVYSASGLAEARHPIGVDIGTPVVNGRRPLEAVALAHEGVDDVDLHQRPAPDVGDRLR